MSSASFYISSGMASAVSSHRNLSGPAMAGETPMYYLELGDRFVAFCTGRERQLLAQDPISRIMSRHEK
jgi:hypothetical protein